MRILVTGAAGFVGSHLCERLLADGHAVVGVDGFIDSYPRPVKERNLSALFGRPGFEFHDMDLRDGRLGPLVEGVEAIVNEAAMPGLIRSWTEFELYEGCNVLSVGRLVEAARAAGVRRFVQASTSSVYGVDAVGGESRPTEPVSPYGATKLAAEHLLLAYQRTFGFPVVILRYFSLFGPRQRPDMAYHIFAEAMLDGRPITIYGDGEQSRSNTYIDDAVGATVLALERAAPGEVYNVGGGEAITVNRAIEILADALGVEPVVEHAPPRPGDQRTTFADTTKARRELGFRPSVPPAEGLARQAAWHSALRGRGSDSAALRRW